MHRVTRTLLIMVALVVGAPVQAQMEFHDAGPSSIPDGQLDPARDLQPSFKESALHRPLPEHYIRTWTKPTGVPMHYNALPGDRAGRKAVPQYLRRVFRADTVPAHATLYVAGPGQATIYLNGREIGDWQPNLDLPIDIHVYELDVTNLLHTGKNVLAIEALRGAAPFTEAEDEVSRHLKDGEILAAMIVPAARGLRARPLVMSDAQCVPAGG